MTARLVALVMIPVSVTCAFAVSEVIPRLATATEANTIDAGVVNLGALVELDGALTTQASLAAFTVRVADVGVTPEQLFEALGIDLPAEGRLARARSDRAVSVLGSSSPVDPGVLRALYGQMDRSEVSPGEALSRFTALGSVARTAIGSRAADLETGARGAHADALVAALESLRAAAGIVSFAAPQGIDLSALWFPSPDAPPRSAEILQMRLAAETADYASARARIRQLGVRPVVAAFDAIEADPRLASFDSAVGTALRAERAPAQSGDAAAVGEVFRGYLTRGALLNDLVATATGAVRDEAQRLAAAQERAFLAWAAVAGGLAAVSVAVAVAFGRSVAKPLRGLAAYAGAVNEGRLDAEPGDGGVRGPRETRVAFAVFAELVANLQLLDAKANALAACAFDDPVLRQPLPGRLGSSLESSAALLSGSMVERDELETHLAHQATHDSLTGIANRTAALVGIQDAILRAERNHEQMALLFIDLNDFKSVNDRYGHEVGDEVLRRIGGRLTDGVRNVDLVARLGGDEFVVISERVAGVDGATDLARRLLDIVGKPVHVGTVTVAGEMAIGVALAADAAEAPLLLLSRAEQAMHRAKGHDGSAIEIFDAELQRHMVEREEVGRALRESLAEPGGGGLVLYFQPVVLTDTGAIVGVEALVRWHRPGHGFLPPDSFIPVAEASSLIIDLDRWVLSEVGRRLLLWGDQPAMANLPIAVNISGRHLESGQLPGSIRALLETTGVDPGRFTIELTETVLLHDLAAAARQLEAVRALGIRVALDDFGTGYTSLAHLQHLPIDIIKIDRSYTSQLDTARGRSLVRMITDLGHAIERDIIAEGVETREELEALRSIGVDQLQGYLLSRPLEVAALEEWVHQRLPVG